MIFLKKLFVLFLAVSFIGAGCGRMNSNPINPDYNPGDPTNPCPKTASDSDGDCIKDVNEIPGNKERKQIQCPLDNGDIIYRDCLTTTDCDCDGVLDSLQKRFIFETENPCGWGCIPEDHFWKIGIGAVLVGGFFATSGLGLWGDDDDEPVKNTQGNDMIFPHPVGNLNWTNSHLRMYKEEEKYYREVTISARCVGKDSTGRVLIPESDCSILAVNEFNDVLSAAGSDGHRTTGSMKMEFDLSQSPPKGKYKQYVKATWDSAPGRTAYIEDPNWAGIPLKGSSEITRSYFWLSSPYSFSYNGINIFFYRTLTFRNSIDGPAVNFAYDANDTNYARYQDNQSLEEPYKFLMYNWERTQ